MRNWIYTTLSHSKFEGIITILSSGSTAQECVAEFVKTHKLSNKKILIDAYLQSGKDEYRYISYDRQAGFIYENRLDDIIRVSSNIILQSFPEQINNSILEDSVKRSLLVCKKEN